MEKLEEMVRDCDLAIGPEQERSRWRNLVNGFVSPVFGGLVSGVTTVLAVPLTSGLVYEALESLHKYEGFFEQAFNCSANFLTAALVATTSLAFSVISANMGVGFGFLERERYKVKSDYRRAALENDKEAMAALENKYGYLPEWGRSYLPKTV